MNLHLGDLHLSRIISRIVPIGSGSQQATLAADALTCCAVVFGPCLLRDKSVTLPLITCDMPCCAPASAVLVALGVRCIRAFACGDVLPDCCFLRLHHLGVLAFKITG